MERLKAELLQDPTIEAMASYMTRLSKRQQVVASNIANIDTPGYKTKDISFHATMSELLSGAAPGPHSTRPEGLEEWSFAPA
jgi:flagellar basal-body rod protein FlgB